MKPSNEEKARFFALYWGQKVMRCDILNGVVGSRVSGLMNVSMYAADIPEYFLELKPLSSISDEDAIELCGGIPEGWEIYRIYHQAIPEEGYCGIKIRRPYPEGETQFNEDGYEYNMIWPRYDSDNVDSLRGKCYAYRFNGHTVEQMIEWGWIKLKT